MKWPPLIDYESVRFVARPVPKPPGVHPLVMCTFIGTALDGVYSWVVYWHTIGVSHFYIYVLIPEVGEERLDPKLLQLVDAGVVTLIDVDLSVYDHEGVALGQMTAIASCVWRYRSTAVRMAFFDTDEFFTLGPLHLGSPKARDGVGNSSMTLLRWLELRGRLPYTSTCARLQSLYGVARAPVERDAAGSITLGWLLGRADWLTAPAEFYRSKCIVETSWIQSMGVHSAKGTADKNHHAHCWRNLIALADATFVHAVNLKSTHMSLAKHGELISAVANDTAAVDGNWAMRQMVEYHAAQPNVTPREEWPPQLGVEPYPRPARHDW